MPGRGTAPAAHGAEVPTDKELWELALAVLAQDPAAADKFPLDRLDELERDGAEAGIEVWLAVADRIKQLLVETLPEA